MSKTKSTKVLTFLLFIYVLIIPYGLGIIAEYFDAEWFEGIDNPSILQYWAIGGTIILFLGSIVFLVAIVLWICNELAKAILK